MAHEIILPDQLTQKNYITLLIRSDSSLPTIDGQWTRCDDGSVQAWYTRPQLHEAVLVGLAIEIGRVQERLSKSEHMISKASGVQAIELQQHWITMLERLVMLLDAQAAVA